jgi:hypothetical protein
VPLTGCLLIALVPRCEDALARNASLFTVAALVKLGFLDLKRHRCRGAAEATLVDVKGRRRTGRLGRLQVEAPLVAVSSDGAAIPLSWMGERRCWWFGAALGSSEESRVSQRAGEWTFGDRVSIK